MLQLVGRRLMCPYSKALFVLVLIGDVDQERNHSWVALHELHHKVEAQMHPLTDQALMPGCTVAYQPFQGIDYHLTLSLVTLQQATAVTLQQATLVTLQQARLVTQQQATNNAFTMYLMVAYIDFKHTCMHMVTKIVRQGLPSLFFLSPRLH